MGIAAQFPLSRPFISISSQLTTFRHLTCHMRYSPFQCRIPVNGSGVHLACRMFVPTRMATLIMVLKGRSRPIRPFRRANVRRPIFHFGPRKLFPGECYHCRLSAFMSLPSLRSHLHDDRVGSTNRPNMMFLMSLPMRFYCRSDRDFPSLYGCPKVISRPLRGAFLAISHRDRYLVISYFRIVFYFLFCVCPFGPGNVLFPRNFSTPIQGPTELTIGGCHGHDRSSCFATADPRNHLTKLLEAQNCLYQGG